VRAGSPAAAGSVLSGGGVAGAISGTAATITLSVGDRFGNAVAGDGMVRQTLLATASTRYYIPHFLNQMASFDVASTGCPALGDGSYSGVVPSVVFTPSAGSVALTPTVGMTDNGDGTFSLKYTVSSGSATTTSAIAGITVAGELVTLGCDPTGAGGAGCFVTVAAAGAAATLVLSAWLCDYACLIILHIYIQSLVC